MENSTNRYTYESSEDDGPPHFSENDSSFYLSGIDNYQELAPPQALPRERGPEGDLWSYNHTGNGGYTPGASGYLPVQSTHENSAYEPTDVDNGHQYMPGQNTAFELNYGNTLEQQIGNMNINFVPHNQETCQDCYAENYRANCWPTPQNQYGDQFAGSEFFGTDAIVHPDQTQGVPIKEDPFKTDVDSQSFGILSPSHTLDFLNVNGRYLCADLHCDKDFSTKHRASTHWNNFHAPEGDRVVYGPCVYCGIYTTPYKCAMPRHERRCFKSRMQSGSGAQVARSLLGYD
ncbi:hypothetical protein HYPSUDRAFT_43890 [Hypholoma sublateritium FD-334 SS-4]|uniref:C2H2-type domain-containing protein n=1 Tax=Hypholoma sublateritium (strain FD-334 SS-4) TaxID=945553 RepID=A0A0D2KZA3_HYPSF|nr:hypothetical protein HYPSUDRAFT_43890 [Hypholoma sublateritium FD-334 SS-4]